MINILLHGGTTDPSGNVGDALMLHEVIRRCVGRFGQDVVFSVRDSVGGYEKLFDSRFASVSSPPELLGRNPFRRYLPRLQWCVKERVYGSSSASEQNVDCILNFMGYRNGDIGENAGFYATRRDAFDYRRWKWQGKKVIHLPQAFGPFRDGRGAGLFKEIVACSDRIFCRDATSFRQVYDVAGEQSHVSISPDITIGADAEVTGNSSLSGKFAIIPNRWMFERVSSEEKAGYTRSLIETVKGCIKESVEPVFVIHAPFQDDEIVNSLQASMPMRLRVFREADPLKMKYALGLCHGIYSSRYHGVLAGLTQNVPTLCSSWSHKYQALLDDYEVPFLMFSNAPDALRDYCLGSEREAVIRTLRLANSRLRKRVESMWSEVWSLIG